MGTSEVPAAKIAAWYRATTQVAYRATVSPEALASAFVTEGEREGVRGDVAFAQAVLETGWFGFPGSVPPGANNFAGLGATDNGGAPLGSRRPSSVFAPRSNICARTPTAPRR
ncbi:MAG TPA: glucosaminidase domain-containing protein, partial [Acidimicrobiia bacterium]